MSRISDLAGFSTSLSSTQDLSVGVITATSFSGDGSGLTGVASTDNIQTATDAKFLANVNITGITTATGGFVGALTGNATGLSGTPNITVGSVTAASGSFSGNVTIGGTLTYQDVTNIDSVGIITAQQGIQVLANGLTITGVSTFNDNIDLQDNDKILLGTGDDLEIYHDGSRSVIKDSGSGSLEILASNFVVKNAADNKNYIFGADGGAVTLYHDNSAKFVTDTGGVKITGVCTATSFSGDGSALTGIAVGLSTATASPNNTIVFLDLSNAQDHKLIASGITTIACTGGVEGESHTVRITNSGITTIGFTTAFMFPSGAAPSMPTAAGAKSLISFTINKAGAAGTELFAGASVNFS